MDADDYFLPWYLDRMVAYAEQNKGIIFSDIIMDDGKERKIYTYPEFQIEKVAHNMQYAGSSILTPWEIAHQVCNRYGGFDTEIPGMEDYCYQIGVHALGFCAFHLPEPLFVYRTYTSTKRENDYKKIESIREYLNRKYPRIRSGEVTLCAGQDLSA
jgi:5'(3')-deoxyribonucleotidase